MDDFEVSNPALDAMTIGLDLNCTGELPAFCRSQPGEAHTSRTVAEWKADGGTFFRHLADPTQGTGRDKLTWFDFHFSSKVEFPGATSDTVDVDGNSFRCDEATYLLGDRGCMFDRVVELFPLSLDSSTNYRHEPGATMTDTAPASRHRLTPKVDHRMFVLRDPRRPNPLAGGAPEDDELLKAAPHGVVFLSAGDVFRPHVEVELWHAPPPPAPGDWDDSAQARFESPSAAIRIASIMGEAAGPDLTLPAAGTYHLRAYSRGRGPAMQRLTIETDYEGVEEWLIQIWPEPAHP